MEVYLKNISAKNMKKQKRLVFRLKALFLIKKHGLSLHLSKDKLYFLIKSNAFKRNTSLFCFFMFLALMQNSDQEKKPLLKFSFFEGTPRP